MITNAVNFVQFDAGFASTNAAERLRTVYWNTQEIGMVDEQRDASILTELPPCRRVKKRD